MALPHLALALLITVVWGVNFVVMKIGLNVFPPLLLSAIRFSLVAVPAIFFFPRPKASWLLIAAFGLTTFALQFGFMFTGISLGMPPGLASLVLQTQAFFTMALASILFRERPGRWKLAGATISFSGICVVAYFTQGTTFAAGFGLTLLAALSWASGNTISKKIGASSPLALVVWGSALALPLIVAATLIFEGPAVIVAALSRAHTPSLLAVAYLVLLSTHFGYSAWGYLLNKYPAATIAPFSLLIPIFGFLSSALFLGEELPLWKIAASMLVIFGLSLSIFEKQLSRTLDGLGSARLPR